MIPAPRLGGQADEAIFQCRPNAPTRNQGEPVATQSMIVSTTFDVQGRRGREDKGVVRGIAVRAPTIWHGILCGLISIIGGQIRAPAAERSRPLQASSAS